MPTLGDEDVGGFDIPMNDARAMGGIERVCDVNSKRQQQIGFKGLAGDAVLQHDAIQKLHGDKCFPILLANVINGADVGMVQSRRSLRLAPKTGEHIWITRNIFGQEFERDKTLQARVFGLVDHAHPSATEFLDNAVVRESLADHGATLCYAGCQRKSMKAG